MAFNPPVPQQDTNRAIRATVLLSLALQVVLIFVAPLRKRSSSPAARFVIWSCYLLADWVADLALGLLLNNTGTFGGGGGSSMSSTLGRILHKIGLKHGPPGSTTVDNGGNNPVIFAFWAPFLLLHLGGPDTITAYSIEDNELWLRHLIGLLFELFSASVIFFCSLRGNPMIPATVLMFIVGIIKYGERTYSLYSGSADGFRDSVLEPHPGPNYARLMEEFGAKEKAGLPVEIFVDERNYAHEPDYAKVQSKSVEARAYKFFQTFRCLFVNLVLDLKERKLSQYFFVSHGDRKKCAEEAFEVIEVELNFMYDTVYTKAPVVHSNAGYVLRFVGSSCIFASLVIFVVVDKRNILPIDVRITFTLLIGAAALDMAALATHLCFVDNPETSDRMRATSKCLSEYMLYLLVKQPDMLSARGGVELLRFRDTCIEARRFFESGGWDPDHADARRMLVRVDTSRKPAEVKGNRSKSVLFDACILAKELRKREIRLWKVIAGAWWDMLKHAAVNCSGSTHARQLSRGGELITVVWFLMAHVGQAEMYQNQEDAKTKLIILDH